MPEATHKARLRDLEGLPCQLKITLQGPSTEAREFLGGPKENNILPEEGLLICPPGKLITCYKKQFIKQNELVTKPGTLQTKRHRIWNSERGVHNDILQGLKDRRLQTDVAFHGRTAVSRPPVPAFPRIRISRTFFNSACNLILQTLRVCQGLRRRHPPC